MNSDPKHLSTKLYPSHQRRMLDSHYRPVARISTGVRVRQITFYAISLRHYLPWFAFYSFFLLFDGFPIRLN